MAEIKREQDMTDAELDAELISFGIDPEQLAQNAFNKICHLYKKASANHAAEVSRLRLLEALKDSDSTLCACRLGKQPRGGCNCDLCATHKILHAAIAQAQELRKE